MLDRLIAGAGAVTDAADRAVRALLRSGGARLGDTRPGSVGLAAILLLLAGGLLLVSLEADVGPLRALGAGAVPVTSTKGVTGHLIGAAGAVEAVGSLLAMRHGLVPPTANHQQRGEGIEADIVAGAPREVAAAPVVSNSFGFGGHNATLVLGPA